MNIVSRGLPYSHSQQRLQADTRIRSEVMKEFSSKIGNHNNAGKPHHITAFAAPGAKSADFEEMTFMMQKTMESKMKSLSRRRFSATDEVSLWGSKEGGNQRIQDIEKLRKIYEQLDNSYDQNHLKKQAGQIYKLASEGKSFSFNDESIPAGSYIWLKEAENRAIREIESGKDPKAKTALQNIQNKLAELDKDEKTSRRIDAGLNTAEIFKNAYQDGSDRNRMRAIYYNNILGAANAGALLQSLISTFGEENLGSNIDKLSKAILADMKAGKPSSNSEHLTTHLNDLNRINTLRSLISDCAEFILGMQKKGFIHA